MSDKDATVQTITPSQAVWDLIDAEVDRSGRTPDAAIEQIIRHALGN